MTDRIRLPVWGTVRATYLYVWSHLGHLALPTFLFLVLELLTSVLTYQLGASSALWKAFGPVWGIVMGIVGFSFAVGIHRTILTDETRQGPSFFHWDRYLWSYTKVAMLIGFVALILAFAAIWFGRNLLLDWMAQPAKLLLPILPALALATWLMSRIGLAFPAAALGRDRALAQSWQGTRGNSLRIIAAGFLTMLPVVLISLLVFLPALSVTGLTDASDDTRMGLFAAGALLARAVLKALSTLIITAEVSMTYRVLCAYQEPSA